jgi:tight adherence protein B
MRGNRAAYFAAAYTLAAVVAMTPARAAETTQIRQLDVSRFPQVSVNFTHSSDRPLRPFEVRVTENGDPVEIRLSTLNASRALVDVALVIDTSGSMKGEPLSSAVAAALQFVTELPKDVHVGVVAFSDGARVIRPMTADHASVLRALRNLQAEGETAMFDAVVRAGNLFKRDAQRNIVLLSDGADTSSEATLKTATAAAKQAEAAVFAVGLQSGEFDAGALRSLSSSTQGRYAPVTTARLTTVYQTLAQELSNQYVVTYTSEETSGGRLEVAVSAAGSSDDALVLAPSVENRNPAPKPKAPAPQAVPSLIERVGTTGVLVYTFAALFLFVMVVGKVMIKSRAVKEFERVLGKAPRGRFDNPQDVREGLGGLVPQSLVFAAEKMAAAGGFTESLDRKLERAGAPLRMGEFIVGTALAGLFGALVGVSLLHNVPFSLIVAAAATTPPFVALAVATRRRQNKMHGQLADILMILASSLRAGHSFMQSLDMVAKEIAEPGAHEFSRVVAEVRLGRPLDDAMNALADRIDSEDFRWALLAVNIQREVGGNLAEILDTVADTMRERETVRRQVDVLTAEGRLSVAILTGLPILVALYMAKVNPDYISLLFTTRIGLMMTFVASCLLGFGILWMRKVVKIDV